MKGPDVKTVGDYIGAQPESARGVLRRVRAAIRKALPRAVEGISYQIPIFKLDGVMVLFFAGFQHHYSIYPATKRVVRGLGKELAGRLHSKGTIRFALDEAVPTGLITRIAKVRAAEVNVHRLARTVRKKSKKK